MKYVLPLSVLAVGLVGYYFGLGYPILWTLGVLTAISFAGSLILLGLAAVIASVDYVRERRRERRFREIVERELAEIFADEDGDS